MRIRSLIFSTAVLSLSLASAVFAGENLTDSVGLQSEEGSWRGAYADILEEMGEERDNYSFALIYVNEDEIPELVC